MRYSGHAGHASERRALAGSQAGFTLAELLVSLILASIVLAAGTGLFIAQSQEITRQRSISSVQGSLRLAMTMLQRDLRMTGYLPGQAAVVNENIPMVEAFNDVGDFIEDADGWYVGWNSRRNTDAIRIYRGRPDTPTYPMSTNPAPTAATHAVIGEGCAGFCDGQVLMMIGHDPSHAVKQVTQAPSWRAGGCKDQYGNNVACCQLIHNPNASELNDPADPIPQDSYSVPIYRIFYFVDAWGRLVTNSSWADNTNYCDSDGWDPTEWWPLIIAQGIEDLQFGYGLDVDSDGQMDGWYSDPLDSGLPDAASYVRHIRATLVARGGKRLSSPISKIPDVIEDHNPLADTGFDLDEYQHYVHRKLALTVQVRNLGGQP